MEDIKFVEPKNSKRLNLLANLILILNCLGSVILFVKSSSNIDSYSYFGRSKSPSIVLILSYFVVLLIVSGCIRGLAELIRQQALTNFIQLNIAKNQGINLKINLSTISSGSEGLIEGYEKYKSNS